MAPEQPGMVIVGAGECGARAALALREAGFAGAVTLVGAERHHPYERPPLSKGTLHLATEAAPTTIASAEMLAARGITLLAPVVAKAIDRVGRRLHLGDGRSLPYAQMLLATGAVPRPLPMAAGLRRCLVLRTFDDALAIRTHIRPDRRLVVIGGGFIGLELAAAARQAGATVTVVEAQDRILGRGVPAEIAAVIHERHVVAGVTIVCGQAISAITETAQGVTIALANGDAVEADVAVVGIGAVPDTDLAAAAGLALDNGIAVDARLRTSDPYILAAGDCCSFPLLLDGGRRVRLEAWRNAQEQGTLAAANMLGREEDHRAVPWFWSDQYDLGLQVAGMAGGAVETVRREVGPGAFILFHLAADGRLVSAGGIGPGNAVARDIRLAEMLIAQRACPPPDRLASPVTKLKALLSAVPSRSAVA